MPPSVILLLTVSLILLSPVLILLLLCVVKTSRPLPLRILPICRVILLSVARIWVLCKVFLTMRLILCTALISVAAIDVLCHGGALLSMSCLVPTCRRPLPLQVIWTSYLLDVTGPDDSNTFSTPPKTTLQDVIMCLAFILFTLYEKLGVSILIQVNLLFAFFLMTRLMIREREVLI